MKATNKHAANGANESESRSLEDKLEKRIKSRKRSISRRAFLARSLAAGAGTIGAGLLSGPRTAEAIRGGLTPGDAALLRFPEALELLEAKLPEGIRVEAKLRAGRAAMLGDPTQVHQVLMNLGTNAVQAMPSGGTLHVSLDAVCIEAGWTALRSYLGAWPAFQNWETS